MNIYLDTNIIIDLCEGECEWLSKLIFNPKINNFKFPFSSEHIEELTDLKSENTAKKEIEIKKRLNFVSNLSSDIYFCNDMVVTEFQNSNPFVVFNTLNYSPYKINAKEVFSNFIPYSSLQNSRNQLNLDPQFLNNVKPENAIKEIDKIISNFIDKINLSGYNKDEISVMGILNKSKQISEDAHKGNYYHNIISKKESYSLENNIVMLFILLDSFGFWPDSKEVYSKGSRFADTRHCFNGVYFDCVISNDLKFCKKSIAVYKYLNINKIVYHLTQNETDIKRLFQSAT